ncbi:14221_t:CDS:2, partial [Dentiscutata erythropus]
MGLIKQQAAVTALIIAQAHCKDEPTKQALYEKHKEFLESQLEKVEEMHDDKEIQGRIYRDVIKARKKEKPQILLPNPKGKNDVFLNERLLQASRRNDDIPQGVLPKVTKFFEDIVQGIKNKFTSRPTTPSPLSQHTLSRTPTPTIEISTNTPNRKRNERGYTPSPDPYERKQQRYKSPSLSSKHTDQISNKEIEIPYYNNVHNEGQSSTYRPVHGTFRGQTYTTYVPETKEKIFSNKKTIIPHMTLMSIKILNSQENRIVGTPIQLAAKGLAIQQGRPNRNYILAMNIGETEKERIKILQERCGNKVWKILGDEMETSINNNVISDIQFILNKKEHEIPDNDKNQGIRKYTIEKERIIKELCEDLEKNDVIYPGYSKWASNVQIITKKDGRKAIVIDYRRLNKHLVKFKQLLPNIMQFLQDISRYKYYTTMNLKSAYWQLNVYPKSQKYTANPDTGVHTNTVEEMWNGINIRIPARNRTKDKIQSYLLEFIWKRQNNDDLWEN